METMTEGDLFNPAKPTMRLADKAEATFRSFRHEQPVIIELDPAASQRIREIIGGTQISQTDGVLADHKGASIQFAGDDRSIGNIIISGRAPVDRNRPWMP